MAFTSNPQLDLTNRLNTGDANQQVILRDQRHAAKLFNSDQFRLAPKHNFSFHVSFGINTGALQNAQLVQRYGQEINMLVKNIDLPSFTIQTAKLNQYNRKKVVQYQAQYGDIGIKFHDDNMGLINHLWQAYWNYYYADARSGTNPGAYARNATQSYSSAIPTPYGFDNGSTQPFFNYIKIYQMARHEYVCYNIINPLITSWNYNKVDYTNQGVHDFDMKLALEGVTFTVGEVSSENVEGFAVNNSHYDLGSSPLVGAIVNSPGTPSFVQSIDTTGLAPGILANAVNSVNENQNTSGALGGIAGGIALATAGVGIFNALGGINGIGSALGGVGSAISSAAGAVGDAVSGAVSGISDALFPGADNNASGALSSFNAPTVSDNISIPATPSDLNTFFG
jgi:hypothetical protein